MGIVLALFSAGNGYVANDSYWGIMASELLLGMANEICIQLLFQGEGGRGLVLGTRENIYER